MESRFLSANKLVDIIGDSEAKSFEVIIAPKTAKASQNFGQMNVDIVGVIVFGEGARAIKYGALVDLCGGNKPVFSVKDDPKHKFNRNAKFQSIVFKNDIKTFVNPETQETIQYYPTRITMPNPEVAEKFNKAMIEFKPKEDTVDTSSVPIEGLD